MDQRPARRIGPLDVQEGGEKLALSCEELFEKIGSNDFREKREKSDVAGRLKINETDEVVGLCFLQNVRKLENWSSFGKALIS